MCTFPVVEKIKYYVIQLNSLENVQAEKKIVAVNVIVTDSNHNNS